MSSVSAATETPREGGAEHPADRLLAALSRLGTPACVGIDPVLERLPAPLRPAEATAARAADALAAFGAEVLDAVAGVVACVKIQAACFERCGPAGWSALERLVAEARRRRFHVILDVKRGDVAVSAAHYAAALFDREAPPDWVTVNGYLGADGIEPFLRPGAGAFALVRTSNPASDAVQAQRLADGRSVAEAVADVVASLDAGRVGRSGYSALGAVVAATKPAELEALRGRMPRQVFLVPGVGAQGGRVEDLRPVFDDRGQGAVVSAGRSVIYAFEPGDARWQGAVAAAAAAFAERVASASAG